MNTRRALLPSALVAGGLLLLSACAPSAGPGSSEAEEPGPGAFPRTVEVPAGQAGEATEVTIESEPQTIAALDYESAEVVAELGLADRLVLVPEAVQNPVLGGHAEELEHVEQTIPVAMELNAETVISLQPDLVLMSPRHGAEQKIGAVLEQADVQTLVVPDAWTSVDSLTANIELIGEATGGEEAAAELSGELRDGLTGSGDAASDDAPRVLVLTNQAGKPFATAGAAFPLELLELAGATDVADDLGMQVTGPISAEQVVEADPDGILLVDMNGSGDRMFAELLANPAVAGIPAVAEDRVLSLTGRDVQALGLTGTITGLEELRAWVSELPIG